jgi:group I intron endonuclease
MEYIKSYTYPFDTDKIKRENLGKSGVYLILNNINLDIYIGSAISISAKHNRIYFRFRNHFYQTHKNTNTYLYNAILKYGAKNFSFHIIEYTSIEKAREIETNYIKEYKPKYNKLAYGAGEVGYKHTEETKEKLKKNYSLERKNLIGSLNKGKNLTEYTKELISIAAKARSNTEEYKLNLSSKFLNSRSKKVAVYDSNTQNIIEICTSAKQVSKKYAVDYRTIRRHLKSEIPIKKRNILLKYYL